MLFTASSLSRDAQSTPLFFAMLPRDAPSKSSSTIWEASKEELIVATSRIAKRLGSQLTKEICHLFELNQKELAFEQLLLYYDKTYQYQTSKRQMIHTLLEKEHSSPSEWAYSLQNFYRQNTL